MSAYTQPTIRFGPFEADLQTQELRKHGTRLRLPGQSFQILRMLLDRQGNLVTRDELRQALWPSDTYVDFDHGVNAAVNRLRETLSDSADTPGFIETLPRRGYRFIGAISQPPPASGQAGNATVLSPVPAEPLAGFTSRHTWPKIAAWILVGAACALVAAFAYLRPRPQPISATLTPLPFTALPGVETAPAFSPDGSRVAFAWSGDPALGAKGFDLYVKGIGSETLLRLTQHPSEWISAAWSPDGAQIAFHRMAGADTGIYIVPALGGPERKLRATHVPYSLAAPISWSSDGRWIAFSDPLPGAPADRIFLLSTENLETRQIPHNPKCLHEAEPRFSHAGSELAYVCVHSTNELEIYSVAPLGGAPKLIVAFSNFLFGFAWTADDKRLVLCQWSDAGPLLYEVTLAEGSLRRLAFAPNGTWPAVSPKGDKLAYSASSDNTNIWRKDLLHPESPAVKLISSTRQEDNPQYSPDAGHIAFRSTRSGLREIWMSDSDGTNLVQISKLNAMTGGPRWSPDGKKMVFDLHRLGHFEVYIVDISERAPRKLLTNIPEMSTPSWSHDGKWIYFRSYETLGHKIYRCPADGGDAIALPAEFGAIRPQESSDGAYLYFATREANHLLKKVLLERPDMEPITEGLPAVNDASRWTLVPGGIYFVPADTPKSIRYFDFATKQVRKVFKSEKDFDAGLSVSPNGRYLLYSQIDQQNSDIMLVDHFR